MVFLLSQSTEYKEWICRVYKIGTLLPEKNSAMKGGWLLICCNNGCTGALKDKCKTCQNNSKHKERKRKGCERVCRKTFNPQAEHSLKK